VSLREAYRSGFEGRPGWRISFDYDAESVEALKQSVPQRDRAYDPETKDWWVALEQEDAILAVFPQFEEHLRQLEMPL